MNAFHIKKHHIRFGLGTLFSQSERKYTVRWFYSLRQDYCIRKPSPWLCFPAIDYIENWVNKHSNIKVFEFGSGGSTLYWLMHGCQVVSIEHDPVWYKTIQNLTLDKSAVDYRLVLPQPANPPGHADPSNPNEYGTSDESLINFRLEDYARQIDTFPAGHFDIVLIDGRARPSCLLHSHTKVKPGGMLIIDNADVPHYLKETRDLLTDYDELIFRGVTPCNPWHTQTNIYIRNSDAQTNQLSLQHFLRG